VCVVEEKSPGLSDKAKEARALKSGAKRKKSASVEKTKENLDHLAEARNVHAEWCESVCKWSVSAHYDIEAVCEACIEFVRKSVSLCAYIKETVCMQYSNCREHSKHGVWVWAHSCVCACRRGTVIHRDGI